MPLNEIRPGLHPVHNGSKSVLKPHLVVDPGDELLVSDAVGDQLLRAGFKDGHAPTVEEDEADEKPKPSRHRRG